MTGRQRYRLDYDVAEFADESLDWATFGRGLSPVGEAEVHLVAPFELDMPMCFVEKGQAAVFCTVQPVAPGHVMVRLRNVPDGAGISLQAYRGAALPEAPPAPEPPADLAADAAATASAPTPRPSTRRGPAPRPPPWSPSRVRRSPPSACRGWSAGRAASRCRGRRTPPRTTRRPADGALGGVLVGGAGGRSGRRDLRPPPTVGRIGEPLSGPPRWLPPAPMRVDDADLDALATVALAPPAELTPAQGGVVLTEAVTFDQLAASLLVAHAEGSVEIVQMLGKPVGLSRGEVPPGDPGIVPFVDATFAGRDEVRLASYDRGSPGRRSPTRPGCGPGGRPRACGTRGRAAGWSPASPSGFVALAAGIAALVVGARDVGAHGTGALPLVALGGVLAGAGLAAAVRSWELRVRTPEGSGLWIRVESFRRFLASRRRHPRRGGGPPGRPGRVHGVGSVAGRAAAVAAGGRTGRRRHPARHPGRSTCRRRRTPWSGRSPPPSSASGGRRS